MVISNATRVEIMAARISGSGQDNLRIASTGDVSLSGIVLLAGAKRYGLSLGDGVNRLSVSNDVIFRANERGSVYAPRKPRELRGKASLFL
jgi:hypothetical protein